jgi:glutathione S-transferase
MPISYFAPGSSVMATHIARHEVDAEFEPHLWSFKAREQQRPDYLALNPEGEVPALVIDGRVLTEVVAMLYYLAKTCPAAGRHKMAWTSPAMTR